MRWSPIPAKALSDKNTNIDINASTKSLVWQPIKLGEVITEANFIPLSDLEDVETITFNGRMKGKTAVESGKGKDVIEVNRQSGKGKLILEDFNKKDTLIVGDETFTIDNIDDAPKFIKFPNA